MTGWDLHTGWLQGEKFTFGRVLQDYSGFLQFIAAVFLYVITRKYVTITEQQLSELRNQYSHDRSPALLYANYDESPQLVNMSPYLVHITYIAFQRLDGHPDEYKVSSTIDWPSKFKMIPPQATASFPEFYNHVPEGNVELLIVFKHGGTGLIEHTLVVPIFHGPDLELEPKISKDGTYITRRRSTITVHEDRQEIREEYEPGWDTNNFFDVFKASNGSSPH